ncbi:MAG TPA: hypothetical protein VKU00_33120, partial [Chthonomonadaceae bacterium]|nr:hypothetical protein [Chthonomonadaceae bacterium]
MQVWQDVLRVALVGTEQQAAEVSTAEPPVGALLEQLSGVEKERNLLRTCGLLTAYRRAGYHPPMAESAPPTPADSEE